MNAPSSSLIASGNLARTCQCWLCFFVLEFRVMGYDIYVDGKHASSFPSNAGWDAAANFVERYTARGTPLRQFAEEGETHQPQEAAAMLADMLKVRKPPPHVQHTLRVLHRHLKWGKHVVISDGVNQRAVVPPSQPLINCCPQRRGFIIHGRQ
jgi:hypothetical protein